MALFLYREEIKVHQIKKNGVLVGGIAHHIQNLSVHSILGIGRNPVKKILIKSWGLCTPQVEVKYLHNRNKISISRKGMTAFAVAR